ncbi:flotillin family protein [Pelagibius sp. Alg239-R121]|uniref:flotillin family protein n=1 Tax=Pelagibius sp. Alg239-R121 TaxID=2993448 RepID=UPI0024A6BCBC|nr:flotillin domain-containing protein [Pelagibius sp. Alg239-R121]
MPTIATLIVLVVILAIAIAFLQRFYRKATREKSLIRTGAGGQKVVMDGGVLVLPFLHRADQIDMRTMRLEVLQTGEKSLMSEDRLRLDIEMEFYLRVQPTQEGVATAAQAIGARALNPENLKNLFGGRFIDAMQAVVATKTMDALHENRGEFVTKVAETLKDNLAQNGLYLESASLVRLDQAAFSALDDNNAFNAVGMRRLAEVISANKKKRAEIEADADVAVRHTQLDSLKRKLELDREQQQAEIAQTLTLEKLKAESTAETEATRQQAEESSARARIERERGVKVAEIERDRALRENEVTALLAAETAKLDSQIALAHKRAEEISAQAETEMKRGKIIQAQEQVQLEKDRLAAERERATALIRAKQESEVSSERSRSANETLQASATAEAAAAERRAEATLKAMQAEAEGKAAMIEAENIASSELLRIKLDTHKIDKLPEIAERMAKPLEKIDSIRINHVSGLGQNGGGSDGGNSPGGSSGPMSGAVDGILNLALQLPAMQKLGESIGVNLDLGNGGSDASSTPDKTSS